VNLIDRLAIFDDRLKQDKNAKAELVQYRAESIAFDNIFTGLQNKNGYLTKPKLVEMGFEWCSQTGYTQDEMMTRLKNLDLDRDYLVNVLGITTVPDKKARERTHMAAYILNTIRHIEGRPKLRVPHSDFIALEFDSDGDIHWGRFEAIMEEFRLKNDVWYLLHKLYPADTALVDTVDADSNPSPPMREIIKKRMEE